MLKEFHLVARTIYTCFAVLTFMVATGLDFSMTMVGIGFLIFVNSFVFQYYVLHFTLKSIATPRGRLFFLIGWLVFCIAGIVGSAVMIPEIQDLVLYASAEEFAHKSALWGSVFVAFSAAFVALTCARRAFSRHGALG